MTEADNERAFTPRETVSELDRFIVGQDKAKRAVAIALRNRWRRKRVDPALRDEIAPKNILLMGPTGCGKTEIARRLAKLARAPFVKVEATKFTEVGYVGRDVDSMVRDLIEASIKMVRDEHEEQVRGQAKDAALERVLDALLPRPPSVVSTLQAAPAPAPPSSSDRTRERMRQMVLSGELNDREIEVDVAEPKAAPMVQMFGAQGGMEDMTSSLQDALAGAFGGGRKKKKKLPLQDAWKALEKEEASRLVDQDRVQREAVKRAEQSGIIFIDEIDKIAARGEMHGADVSRQGVQRDLLPLVEGTTVSTKYGMVRTDHILFVASGAFHLSRPSDLIPELQGRLPIRLELQPLTEADFVRILTETESSLAKQATALLATEDVKVSFTPDGLAEIAKVAAAVNAKQENIGARRLATVMERLLEEESFHAPDRGGSAVVVDGAFVRQRLEGILQREDLSKYIL